MGLPAPKNIENSMPPQRLTRPQRDRAPPTLDTEHPLRNEQPHERRAHSTATTTRTGFGAGWLPGS